MKPLLFCAALLALAACRDAPSVTAKSPDSAAAADGIAKAGAEGAAKSVASAADQPYVRKPNKKVVRPKKVSSIKKQPIEWTGAVNWVGWDEGLKTAKAEKKPICLVLYADWCPRCKDLAPVFSEGEIARLGAEMVMVRQNVDDRPAWLNDYQSLGTYVPRIFFFDAEGNIQEELTSAHARYPYFYTPAGKQALEASMRKALGKS